VNRENRCRYNELIAVKLVFREAIGLFRVVATKVKIDLRDLQTIIYLFFRKASVSVALAKLDNQLTNNSKNTVNISLVLEYARYLLKHLSDILLELGNPLRKAAFFAVLFNSTPTYTEINFETPKNSPLPEINGLFRIGLEYESIFGGPSETWSRSATPKLHD